MKENKISVEINKPASDVFRFTINPSNTTKWIEEIKKEETNEWPVKVGSIYKNVDIFGKWSVYVLVRFKENRMFELLSEDKNYHVRYTYTPISETKSHLEYYEWVDEGNLQHPFSQEVLSNLKRTIEQ
ncbi:MAG: SRPBCC family protein [Patescibacteria group bacterium]|jgi:hypothetical protein